MFLPSNITLKFGDTGDFVTELQRRLTSVGFHAGEAHGTYDGVTVNSVSSFQARSGLRADGIAGPETLKRLNGIVSGDTSSSDNNGSSNQEEEEAKALAAQQAMARELQMQAAPPPPEMNFGVQPQETRTLAQMEAAQYAAYEQPVHPQPTPQPVLSEQQMLQQQILREQQLHQQSPHANATEQLAQMLAQHTQQPQHQQPMQPQPPQHQPVPEMQYAQPPVAHPQPQPQQQAPVAHEAQPEQAKGIVGRAIQKMDAMLQKMSDYFEAKLSPDVLREVKNLGATMMQSGVKEVAIPEGPEQTRGPAAPSRGPEQAQVQQRG